MRKDIQFLVLGAFITFLGLLPYWIFGRFSALGWHDEFQALIPWLWNVFRAPQPDVFFHQFTGGTGPGGYMVGQEPILLFRVFSNYLDTWQALLLLRWGGLFSLFSGIFYYSQRVSQNQNRSFAFGAGLFGAFTSFLPYGWTMGGHGWDLSAAVWLNVILLGNFKSEKQRLLLGLVVSTIACTVSAPVFLGPMALYIFCFGLSTSSTPRPKLWSVAAIAGIFLVCMITNWYTNMLHAVVEAKSYSTRLNDVLGERQILDGLSLWNQITLLAARGLEDIVVIFRRAPGPFMNAAYAVFLVLALFGGEMKKKILFLIFAFISPLVLSILFTISNIPVLKTYRWSSILWLLLPVLLPLFISTLKTSARLKRVYAVFFLVFATIGARSLIIETFELMAQWSGAGAITELPLLRSISNSHNHYRTISNGRMGMTPVFYGLDMFDGMVGNIPYRRTYFLAFAAHSTPQQTYPGSRQFFYKFPEGLDVAMFEMANVKFVVSTDPIIGFHLIGSTPERVANEIDYPLKSLVGSYFANQVVLRPVYLYELSNPWPRIFSSQVTQFSESSYREVKFYSELKKQTPLSLLIAREDIPQDFTAWKSQPQFRVKSYDISGNTVTIDISPEGGVLAYNQVYEPHWTATCDSQELAIIPANGIMMAVHAPPGCTQVVFTYKSRGYQVGYLQ